MTARDLIHEAVRAALIRDGWTIVADPFVIDYQGVRLYADLAAERPLAAEREGRRIVVEVKSFVSPSLIHDFELALGQYALYRAFLEQVAPDHALYLAVPLVVYDRFFARPAIRLVIDRFAVALVVVDVDKQEVARWTS
jgi:hypothetical protein